MRDNSNFAALSGELKLLIVNAGLAPAERPGEDLQLEEIRQREARLERARYLMQLLDIKVFELNPLSCTDDIFMEVLINNVRNEVCSFQNFFLKEKNNKLRAGINTLNNLKKNYKENADAIRQLENSLNTIVDANLRAELENYDIFEHLEAEKITPRFLRLAQNSVPKSDLNVIKMMIV
jgi:hypothetical protein